MVQSAVPKKKVKKTTPKKAAPKKKVAPKKEVKKQSKKKAGGFGVGSNAPDFQGVTNEHEEPLSLSDFAGQYLVLYFYPKDNTPGCTKEGQRFRDLKEKFDALNCEILGVSADKAAAHQRFIDKYNFNFSLLADTERKVIKAYGATKVSDICLWFILRDSGSSIYVMNSLETGFSGAPF